MKKQHGFTLIELLVVIIILGIISVTAAPKFLNLGSDARANTIKAAEGALKSTTKLVFTKAAAAGKHKGVETILFDGNTINIVEGYPSSRAPNIQKIINTEGLQVTTAYISGFIDVVVIQPEGFEIPLSQDSYDYECAVIYEHLGIGIDVHTQDLDKC